MCDEPMMEEDHRIVPMIPISVAKLNNGWTEICYITVGPDNRIHHYNEMPMVSRPYSQE